MPNLEQSFPWEIWLALALILFVSVVLWNGYLLRQIRLRKKAEDKLAEQMNFQKEFFNIIPHPVYVRDREGRLVTANSCFFQATGEQQETLLGKKITEVSWFSAEEGPFYQTRYLEALADGKNILEDLRLKIKDEFIDAEVWLIPYKNAQGEISGMIGGWTDVTERYRLLNEVEHARQLADDARELAIRANQAKGIFLATMSHEIRTPVSAVLGMLELTLRQAEKGHLEKEAIETAYDSANSLLVLLGDVLDLAKIESGQWVLSAQRCNPLHLTQSVIKVFSGLAGEKNISLAFVTEGPVGHDVLLDAQRFRQVLNNLISNAVKFTDTGGVIVTLTAEKADEANTLLTLCVQDTGTGIAVEDQDKLFKSYSQLYSGAQQHRGGTGLGLVICKEIVEMMGGDIKLTSQAGKGTRIDVTLKAHCPGSPAEENTILAPQNDASADDYPLNVLVVDDHPANRLLLRKQLEFLGHHVWLAQEGEEAFSHWKKQSFDVVITDCNMPGINGYQLTRWIRDSEREQGQKTCAILGLTANAQYEEVERCQLAGMDTCLFKPLNLQQLRQQLEILHSDPLPVPCCDPDGLEALTGGNRSATVQLINGIIKANRDDLNKIRLADEQGDREKVAEITHRIKGIANMLTAHPLVSRCEELELQCGTAADLTSAIALLSDAMNNIDDTLNAWVSQYKQNNE